jgi:hypothetical protein
VVGAAWGPCVLVGGRRSAEPAAHGRDHSSGPPQVYVAVRVALVSAIVVTASPHFSRPFRLTGRLVLMLGAVSAVALGAAYPVGVIAGFAVGLGAASLAHLILGSPGGELSDGEVSAIMVELGLTVSDVRTAPVHTAGVVLKTAVDQEGGSLLIKVYGRDAWEYSRATWVRSSSRR